MKEAVVTQVGGAFRWGLSNQMMMFLGLVLLAHEKNASLLLPQWRTSYPSHEKALADTYAVWGNINWPAEFPPVITALPPDFNESAVTVVDGWRVRRPRNNTLAAPLYTQLLVPRPELQHHVDAFVQRYGASYGALHARVERDMRDHGGHGKAVISLEQILQIMHGSTLEKVDVLFVAVGDDLLAADRRTLERGVTPWGGRLVRRELSTKKLTYMDHGIIDMAICTQARYFVGFPRSTFSLMVHYKRARLSLPGTSFYYDRTGGLSETSPFSF